MLVQKQKITDQTLHINNSDKKTHIAGEIKKLCGEDVYLCYQCGKCTAGCPAAFAMDITPNNIIRLAQLGIKDDILKSRSIWVCTSCETCATRCPHDVALSKIMDASRQIAKNEGAEVAVPEIKTMHEELLRQVSWYGRTHEIGMMGLYKLRTGFLSEDMFSGIEMILKGKMALLPGKIKWPRKVNKLFKKKGDDK